VSCMVYLVAFLVLNGFEVKMWADHKSEHCSANLPLWLLIDGAVGYAYLVLSCLQVSTDVFRAVNAPPAALHRDPSAVSGMFAQCIKGLLEVFTLAWLIVGSVYVYRMAATPSRFVDTSCDRTCFMLTWYIVTLKWTFAAFLLLAVCCLVVNSASSRPGFGDGL